MTQDAAAPVDVLGRRNDDEFSHLTDFEMGPEHGVRYEGRVEAFDAVLTYIRDEDDAALDDIEEKVADLRSRALAALAVDRASAGTAHEPEEHPMTAAAPVELRGRKPRAEQEEEAAQVYAAALRAGFRRDWWTAYNAEIIDRFSLTALRRIKARAWRIVESREAEQ